ncbi:unnamed protein product [Paramecium primaurelia]|uniref:Ras-GEF domain-containing protein n=1 Tax=Paramecium primaurelia TaxID=5886 RepID=A0A8S1PP51_PARPR|nr:unnamed protein product [Paramecium primaurelia]
MRKPPLKILFEDNELEIIKAKTHDVQSQNKATSFYSNISDGQEQLSEGKLYQCDTSYSSSSLHSSRTLLEESQWQNYQKRIDSESLSEQAKKVFVIPTQSSEEWLANFTEKCLKVECFFKDTTFNTIIETTFNSDDQQLKQTLVLTLDYFTNLVTFTFFLLWKAVWNENQQDMTQFVSNSNSITEYLALMISLRVNEFRIDFQLLSIFESIIQPFPDKSIFKECTDSQRSSLSIDIIQQKIFMPLMKHNQVLPWQTDEVAFVLSFINSQFYADLQIRNIIVKGGLNNYFRRINTISQFIIYSVVRNPNKHDRQDALGYWIDLAEKLQQNYDLEGLFIVYKYGIQLLLKDYIGTMPVLFRDLNRIPKINAFYEEHIKHNFKDSDNQKQHLYIPSFHKFITQIKRLELQIKTNKSLFHQISDIMFLLVKMSKRQQVLYQQMCPKISENEEQMIHYFTKGIEKELEANLQIPLDKETLVYIELIKLAKNIN